MTLGRALATLSLAALASAAQGEKLPPELSFRALDGTPARLGAYAGKVVLLDVWATWCDPCRDALPAYDELYRSLAPRGLEVVAVSIDERDGDVKRFLAEHPVGYTVLRDPTASIAEAMNVRIMPTSFVVGRDGSVRARHDGFRRGDVDKVRHELEGLLAEGGAAAR